MRRIVTQQTREKIRQALTGKVRGGSKKIKGKLSGKRIGQKIQPKQTKGPMQLKESEGFTGARSGTSPTRLNTKSNKGKAMEDRMANEGMSGYRTKGKQAKSGRQGEYRKNLDRFMGSK